MLADTKRKLGQVVYVDMVCVCVCRGTHCSCVFPWLGEHGVTQMKESLHRFTARGPVPVLGRWRRAMRWSGGLAHATRCAVHAGP